MGTVRAEEVFQVLDAVDDHYRDDLPPDNVEKIVAGLLKGTPPQDLSNSLETGGLQMDYKALIDSFIATAGLVIAVIEAWLRAKADRRDDAAAPDEDKLIVDLLDPRVRRDPKLRAIVEAVRSAHP